MAFCKIFWFISHCLHLGMTEMSKWSASEERTYHTPESRCNWPIRSQCYERENVKKFIENFSLRFVNEWWRYFLLVSRDNSVMNGIKKHWKSDKSWIWKFEMKNFYFRNVNKCTQWSIYSSNIPRKWKFHKELKNFRENKSTEF